MNKQKIYMDELGMPYGLVHRNNADLTKLGQNNETCRYSEILYTCEVEELKHLEGNQVVIRILKGFAKGMLLTDVLYEHVTAMQPDVAGTYPYYNEKNKTMLFDDYETAIRHEVLFYNGVESLKRRYKK